MIGDLELHVLTQISEPWRYSSTAALEVAVKSHLSFRKIPNELPTTSTTLPNIDVCDTSVLSESSGKYLKHMVWLHRAQSQAVPHQGNGH